MRKQSQLFEEVVRELIGVFAVESPIRTTADGINHSIIFRTKYDWLFISVSDHEKFMCVDLVIGEDRNDLLEHEFAHHRLSHDPDKQKIRLALVIECMASLKVVTGHSDHFVNRMMAHVRNLKKALA